ncbi:MAG: DUF5682 family protein, partial [bacterium]
MLNRTFENIVFWPIFHYRMEFAAVVRQALLADPPDVVAVEFPGTWREPILQGVNRLPFLSLVLGQAGEEHLYLPIEPTDAGVEALRTGRELGLPLELIDLDVERYPAYRDAVPDSHAVHRLGYDAVMGAFFDSFSAAPDALDEQRETMMAHALQQLSREGARIACVVGAAHLPGLLAKVATPQPRPLSRARPRDLRLYNWSEKSSREFLTEPPFLAAAYERWRGSLSAPPGSPPGTEPVEREAASEKLVREAVEAYERNYHEQLDPQRLRTLAVFAKKYALVDGLLVPDLYHLVVAARGVADDDLAYELWERGSYYPWQDGSGLLPTIDIDETFARLNGRRLTLHRKIRRNRPRLKRFSNKKRLREQFGDDWKKDWSGHSICSHPPEDLVIEDYGRYLKHKAKGMLSAERTRVEPFQVSLKDGLDVRETLRHWHEQRLFVREVMPLGGEVGSVVVIFDEDRAERGRPTPPPGGGDAAPPGGGNIAPPWGGNIAPPGGDGADSRAGAPGEHFPWRVTWLGEHEQESDMALYATPAGEDVVGPGISRCEYGGFVLSYPPRRMVDVWNDPYFEMARTKPERLLLAGLDYSVERNVLYVAER